MKKQLIAIIVLLILVGAAVFALVNRSQNQPVTQQELLLPELANVADKIDTIEIINGQGTVVVASRSQGRWATELSSSAILYPLEQVKLAELVSGLKQAKLREAKTTKQENFSHLGLTDVTAPDSLATLVKLSALGQHFEILIGNVASSGQGSYVRMAGEKQTWLLDRVISIPTSQSEWLKQPILDIQTQQVDSVVKVGDKGFTVVRNGNDESQYTLAQLGAQQNLKYQSIVDGYVENLVNLRFEKIITDSSLALAQKVPDAAVNITLADGSEYEMTLYKLQENVYVQFTDVLNAGQHYWEGVSFQISSFAAGQLQKSFDDFIQPVDSQIDSSQVPTLDEGESPQ